MSDLHARSDASFPKTEAVINARQFAETVYVLTGQPPIPILTVNEHDFIEGIGTCATARVGLHMPYPPDGYTGDTIRYLATFVLSGSVSNDDVFAYACDVGQIAYHTWQKLEQVNRE